MPLLLLIVLPGVVGADEYSPGQKAMLEKFFRDAPSMRSLVPERVSQVRGTTSALYNFETPLREFLAQLKPQLSTKKGWTFTPIDGGANFVSKGAKEPVRIYVAINAVKVDRNFIGIEGTEYGRWTSVYISCRPQKKPAK